MSKLNENKIRAQANSQQHNAYERIKSKRLTNKGKRTVFCNFWFYIKYHKYSLINIDIYCHVLSQWTIPATIFKSSQQRRRDSDVPVVDMGFIESVGTSLRHRTI